MAIDADYFWARVEKGDRGACWPWTRGRFPFGHGFVKLNGRTTGSHRIAWHLARGPIPEGLCVLHKCDNPPCCNPDHLFLGTHRDNANDRHRKGRTARINHTAKVSAGEVAIIRAEYKRGVSTRDLSARYHIDMCAVWRIATYRTWRWVA